MDSGADCSFYSNFIGVPGGAVHDSRRKGLENVVFPMSLQCFSRDQSVGQSSDSRGTAVAQPWHSRGTVLSQVVSQLAAPPVVYVSATILIFIALLEP